ncbi:MAG: hypothetical protein GF333_01600 [Candidatus Omnitrophica bacterium]|nr:hypothetical protein [Candidatus Omnitrophota bacterium]
MSGTKMLTDEIPRYPDTLPGSVWGLTTYYNPAQYRNKLANYRIFRERVKRQGLSLITVEIAFGRRPFELENSDAEVLIQRRTRGVLWQKERALNIALQALPDECDKIIWLDADVLFYDDRWIVRTCRALQEYVVVQPFSFFFRLPKGFEDLEEYTRRYPDACRRITAGYGIGYGIAHLGREFLREVSVREAGTVGFAWAARRSVFSSVGFYDASPVGVADAVMAYGFYGAQCRPYQRYWTESMRRDQALWTEEIYRRVRGSVFWVDGRLGHLWHGDVASRMYVRRQSIEKKCRFNPRTDIKKDAQDCWIWATRKKKRLRFWVRWYFWMRNEECNAAVRCLRGVTQMGTYLARVLWAAFPRRIKTRYWQAKERVLLRRGKFPVQTAGLVSGRYRCLYVGVPTSSGSSWTQRLAGDLGMKFELFPGCSRFWAVTDIRAREFHRYFKFCFVRNPWERAAAGYVENIRPLPGGPYGRGGGGRAFPFFRPGMSFEEFIRVIHRIPDYAAERWFRSNYACICDPQGRKVVDFVGRYEHWERDWATVYARLGLVNRSAPGKDVRCPEYRHYYNETTKALVEQRYRRDIELFGYEF